MDGAIGDIKRAVRDLGLSGSPVCMHTSLRSFGHPAPDADAVIDTFLDAGCTVLVPTGSHGIFGVPPPETMRPERNGTDYINPESWNPPHDRIFDVGSDLVDEGLGTLPRMVLQREGHVRGHHPISSFTAVGPLAHVLVGSQMPDDVYAPLAELAGRDGFVLLIGVGITRMTLLHLAEKRAGRTLFRRWARGADGEPTMVEAGSCSEGFGSFEATLRPIASDRSVGSSTWQVFDARSALDRAAEAIRRDPHITHCGASCLRCDHAVAGGPLL